MKTTTQIFIDKIIAKPVAWVLNFITRIAGKVLGINHDLDKPFKTIAVCKFKGMGSIIQSTPLLQALRSLYPDAEIIFVSTCGNKAIVEKIDTVNTFICIDDSSIIRLVSSMTRALWKLIRKRPDVYIDLEIYSDFSTIFTLLTLSRNRLGYYLRSSSYRLGIYTHMMFFNPRVPINEVYLQMARLLGYKGERPELHPLFTTAKLEEPLPSKPYILINPNASDLRIERRWHRSNFNRLIATLLEKYPEMEIILIGSKSERDYSQSVIDNIDDRRVTNLAGRTTLDYLIHLVKNARFIITNDTGPMHIAFSTFTPSVCLFGPCSPEQYGNNRNAFIIYNRVYCSPCVHDFEIPPCKGNNVCMQRISLEDVLQQVHKILTDYPPTAYSPDEVIFCQGNITLGLIKR